MIKILLVEDDLGLSNSVFDFLDDFADVMQVFDGEEGLYEAESGVYDLILLDLMLPEKDGFQVLKDLREKGVTTPVLIMTAKESLDDKGHGFELGADDYLTKPFYLEELKMRIQALLKRSGKFNENTLSYGDVTVNLSTNATLVEGKEVELPDRQYEVEQIQVAFEKYLLKEEIIIHSAADIDALLSPTNMILLMRSFAISYQKQFQN